jgi:HSP20 family protein
MGSYDLVPFDSFSNLLDKVFHKDNWLVDFDRLFNLPLSTETKFPVDVVLKDNRDLEVSAALAGYPKDSVSIDFDGDYMTISVKKEEKRKEDDRDKYICRGIKKSSSKVRFYVPTSRYDQASTKANLSDGMLKVSIPAREETKPRKVEIDVE